MNVTMCVSEAAFYPEVFIRASWVSAVSVSVKQAMFTLCRSFSHSPHAPFLLEHQILFNPTVTMGQDTKLDDTLRIC